MIATATQNGHSKISGVIEQLKRNGNRTAVKVNGKWFSTFGTCNVNEGDMVDLSYTVSEKNDRVYLNIKQIEVQAQGQAPTPRPAGKDDAINRAVALKAAVAWGGPGVATSSVLKAADEFLAWLGGGQQ